MFLCSTFLSPNILFLRGEITIPPFTLPPRAYFDHFVDINDMVDNSVSAMLTYIFCSLHYRKKGTIDIQGIAACRRLVHAYFFFAAKLLFGYGGGFGGGMRRLLVAGMIWLSSVAWGNWSGIYVGGNSGAAIGTVNFRTDVIKNTYFFLQDGPAVEAAGRKQLQFFGYTGGIQIGFNRQGCSSFVWGVETDFGAFHVKKSRSVTRVYPSDPPNTFSLHQSVRTHWLLTVRPRVGFACGQWLLYATGGFACTDIRSRGRFLDSFRVFESSQITKTTYGWTAGAGLERALSCWASCFVSYLYADFGDISVSGALTNSNRLSTLRHRVKVRSSLVRAGLNFKL